MTRDDLEARFNDATFSQRVEATVAALEHDYGVSFGEADRGLAVLATAYALLSTEPAPAPPVLPTAPASAATAA